ncbi:energy transducer TonB family protein [Shimia haliotis]|uniref:TonB C terminal n=1 Tax=Shimia haliotis TaxID=1280847 RepID=A0A1I4DQ11_9RHOB|nr:energy transducer TonB [Shimia haliotis]SFK94730.1 TonB C terminal [Shimia haliotis]
MIRRSLFIASFALLFSLCVHLLGLGVVVRVERAAPPPDGAGDVVTLSNTFEDFAEVEDTPEVPEPAPEPEPEQTVEPVTPPSDEDIPDTEVHVESDNPRDTFAPDTGTAQIVEPVPLAGTQSDFVPQPDVTEPTAEPDDADPVQPVTDVPAPLGTETDIADAVDPVDAEAAAAPVEPDVTEPVEDAVASLPEADLSLTPVSPLVDPDAAVIEEPELVEPIEDAPEDPVEETKEAEEKPLFPGWKDGFEELRNPTETVESPLETYRREGSLATVGGFGIQSGSAANSRGPGNSDRTNYAGRVLVHLNRTPPVHVKAVGWARVYFEISAKGALNWVEVVDSSGNADVNRAARVQIQRGAPFPLPPNGKSRQLSFWYRSG